MTIEPFGDKLIVKQIARKEKSKGGLLLTDSISEKPSEGVIVAKSKGVKLDIFVGDQILFNKFAGEIITDKEEEYLILREEDIYGRRNK